MVVTHRAVSHSLLDGYARGQGSMCTVSISGSMSRIQSMTVMKDERKGRIWNKRVSRRQKK